MHKLFIHELFLYQRIIHIKEGEKEIQWGSLGAVKAQIASYSVPRSVLTVQTGLMGALGYKVTMRITDFWNLQRVGLAEKIIFENDMYVMVSSPEPVKKAPYLMTFKMVLWMKDAAFPAEGEKVHES